MASREDEDDMGGKNENRSRDRKLTEKGYDYQLSVKRKRLLVYYKILQNQSDKIRSMMSVCGPGWHSEDVRLEYKRWLSAYESYMATKDELYSFLNEQDIAEFDKLTEVHMMALENLKAEVEECFIKHPKSRSASIRSHKTTRSVLSKYSDTWVEEKQKELRAKAESLQERHVLELAKLQIEMKKEELELKTQIKISQAKSKVLEDLENSSHGSATKLEKTDLENKENMNPSNATQKKIPVSSQEQHTLPQQLPVSSQEQNTLPQQTSVLSQGQHILPHLISATAGQHPLPPQASTHQHAQNLPILPPVPQISLNTGSGEQHPWIYPAYHHNCNPYASSFEPERPTVIQGDQHEALSSVVRHLRRPIPEIDKFTGNPIDFRRFMRQFQTKILVNCDTDEERLQYLDQFTDGDAKRIVRGFTYLDSSRGYEAALRELEDRYGNNEVVARAFTKKALEWPTIKNDDAKMLDQFSIFLTECENAVLDIEAARILEHPDTIRKLVMKLPFYYHDKWRNVVEQRKNDRKSVTFTDLTWFVKREARKAMDPTYERDALKTVSTYNQRQNINKLYGKTVQTKAFATDIKKATDYSTGKVGSGSKSTEDRTKYCHYCSKSHNLDTCYRFLAYSVPERLAFMKTKGICFRCLARGHMARDCPKVVSCEKCRRNHQTILHMEENTEPKTILQKKVCAGAYRKSVSHMEAGECTLAVIPVKVAVGNSLKVVSVYAFMDPGSTVSFCSQALIDKLGCDGKRVNITIDTMS